MLCRLPCGAQFAEAQGSHPGQYTQIYAKLAYFEVFTPPTPEKLPQLARITLPVKCGNTAKRREFPGRTQPPL